MGQRLAALLVASAVGVTMPAWAGTPSDDKQTSRNVLALLEGHGAEAIDAFLMRIRPAPLDAASRTTVLASLPPTGEVRPLKKDAERLPGAQRVLDYSAQPGSIVVKVIAVDSAFVGLRPARADGRTDIATIPERRAKFDRDAVAVGLSLAAQAATPSDRERTRRSLMAHAADEMGHDYDSALAQSNAVAAPPEGEHSEGKYREAVGRAVELLPRRPAQVVVIDVTEAKPEDRDYLLKLQAFIIRGRSVVYLTMHGDVLRLAQRGSRFHEYMLATVIWHEMAHLDGADEAEARRREEALWTRFMLDNAVDRDAALSYLVALKHRAPLDDQEPSNSKLLTLR
jgi:hypothetical protein